MTTRTTIRALRTKTRTSKPQARAWLLCAVALVGVLSALGLRLQRGARERSPKPLKFRSCARLRVWCAAKKRAPVQGAVVYLQDSKSLAVKSYLSDVQGRFHFRQLSMNLDFNLWAELNGKRSKTKTISQFNSKTDLDYKLKLPVSK